VALWKEGGSVGLWIFAVVRPFVRWFYNPSYALSHALVRYN